MAHYRIVEWDQYQHYKDRDPPWIKLHRDTLTSRTWVMLGDRGRVLALACMLVAAGTNNEIPADPAFLRRRAYLDYDPDFAPLVEVGFLELINDTSNVADASKAEQPLDKQMLADDTECSSEERQRRAEKRREEERAFQDFSAAAAKQNWPTPRKLDADRRRKLRARLDEHGEVGWREMLARAEASEWIKTSFPLKFDWILEPKNFRKVIEGNYDAHQGVGASRQPVFNG